MAAESIISQGVDLMIYGMGTVFVFLTMLVLVTNLMSFIVQRFLPDPVVVEAPSRARAGAGGTVDTRTLSVLQAAVDAYRNRK